MKMKIINVHTKKDKVSRYIDMDQYYIRQFLSGSGSLHKFKVAIRRLKNIIRNYPDFRFTAYTALPEHLR